MSGVDRVVGATVTALGLVLVADALTVAQSSLLVRALASKLKIPLEKAREILAQAKRNADIGKVQATVRIGAAVQKLENSGLGRCVHALASFVVGEKRSALLAVGRECGALFLHRISPKK